MNTPSILKYTFVFALLVLPPIVKGGESLISNGGFEEIVEITSDEDRKRYGIGTWELGNEPPISPVGWKLQEGHEGKMTMIGEGMKAGLWSCQIENGWLHSKDFEVSEGSAVKVTFQAKGSGKVTVRFYQYEYDEDGSPRQFLPSAELEAIDLDEDWQEYSMEYQFSNGEVNRAILAFDVPDTLVLDEVTVEKTN